METKHLFSIGEVAKSIGVTRRIILNYEAKGLVHPDKKDGDTGNRYYTIDTFTQIRAIRIFQDLGLSLDEIHGYFADGADLQPIIQKLEKKRDELALAIEKLKERSNKGGTVTEIVIEPQTIYRRSYASTSIADKTNLLRNTALEAMKAYGTDTTRRMYFIETSAADPDTVAYCVAVPTESEGEYVQRIPALRAIALFHHGAYEEIPNARKKLFDYAAEHNLQLSGVFRSLFLEGPPQHEDTSKFITQLIALIK